MLKQKLGRYLLVIFLFLDYCTGGVSYGQKSPETDPPRQTENPYLTKIKKIDTINDHNVLASSRLMGESCESLASNFDEKLLNAIIELYGAFINYDQTHFIFIEILPIAEKFPAQLQKAVEQKLNKKQQAIFWERLAVAKREAQEGNG